MFLDMAESWDPEKCVICAQGFESLDQKVVVTVKGVNTIRELCKPRNRPDLKKYLTQCLNEEDQENVKFNVQVLTHKLCRRNFTDLKRKTVASEKNNGEKTNKRLRSSLKLLSWKKQCFLCGKEASKDERHPDRNYVYRVTLIEFKNRIVHHCERRNDEWGIEVLTRISTSNDLVADDAIYRKDCFSRFVLNWPSPEVPKAKRGRPIDETCQKWFEVLSIWLETEADGELYSFG